MGSIEISMLCGSIEIHMLHGVYLRPTCYMGSIEIHILHGVCWDPHAPWGLLRSTCYMGSIISWVSFALRWSPAFYAVYLSKKLDLCPVEFPVFWIWLICVTVMGFSVIFCIWQLFWGKSLDLGFSGITSSGDFDFLMLTVTSKRWHCIAWHSVTGYYGDCRLAALLTVCWWWCLVGVTTAAPWLPNFLLVRSLQRDTLRAFHALFFSL